MATTNQTDSAEDIVTAEIIPDDEDKPETIVFEPKPVADMQPAPKPLWLIALLVGLGVFAIAVPVMMYVWHYNHLGVAADREVFGQIFWVVCVPLFIATIAWFAAHKLLRRRDARAFTAGKVPAASTS